MAMLVKEVLHRVAQTLSDEESVHWQIDELVRWFNDARRELAIHRPDAFAVTEDLALVAGARQSLPATAIKLIDIPNNAGGDMLPVRQIARADLDEVVPGWRKVEAEAQIKHFMYDPRVPRTFEVYPPASAGQAVTASFSKYLTDIAEPASGTWNDVVGSIGVPDIYGSVLADYVLYRAFGKDSEVAANLARAQAHYGAFAAALGIDVSAGVTVQPGVRTAGGVATT